MRYLNRKLEELISSLDYVLQRALQIAEEPRPLDGLVNALRPQLLAMRRHSSTSPFTKHISSGEYGSFVAVAR